ncbi:Dls1p NDAI_0G05730 [Naumovozyma dairenensis CBS 421]|uniref:Transcription factor CBF/NF-Y/archaeal histone domain-containing protein n=1 Tax=Naumovozyma dairenensis (strain ATCC 10597 / BCRC 20456 / CBS 421 / NBRC 0211 / NRRL Y-12639) TaxID=1071378 RepID=J7S4N8_NAUDC|nr:hypothetical protein NDAI_0G05730 [Naumovozyma dairenensis CBS 421]CCK73556.1 hypothetical protein NDAI_0G05730 [Naumovozyma dairenensis CBS 421]
MSVETINIDNMGSDSDLDSDLELIGPSSSSTYMQPKVRVKNEENLGRNEVESEIRNDNDYDEANDQDFEQLQPRLSVDIVERIAKNDPEYMDTDDSAYIATAFATELFIKTLTMESMINANFHRMPVTRQEIEQQPETESDGDEALEENQIVRLTYNDFATTVKSKESFHFLGDLIPMTKNLKDLVQENKVRYTTALPQSQILGSQG